MNKAAASAETIPFAAETAKVLQLMIHSLYTNKDIFLRELISNASDACDKLRYEALTNPGLLGDAPDLAITITLDPKAGTLSVADTGIGMNRGELVDNLGTIARSGTQAFLGALSGDAKKDTSLIGQFGVGFYSSFMVADKVTVLSRRAGEEASWQWQSRGDGSFSVTEAAPGPRGTIITLTLKPDAKEYLDTFRVRHIAETYSDHIGFPIRLVDAEGHEEVINSASALWARPKSEVSQEQYEAFYRSVAHSPDKPWLTLHSKAEGKVSYSALLYIPSMKPFDLYHPDRKRRVKLYVKRVYIADEGVDLIPPYLRFLRGVIDSEDLPLNISRETLQKNKTIDTIRDAVTAKVVGELKKRIEKDSADYASFWALFGPTLKEGLCEGPSAKEKLLEICQFKTTRSSEGWSTLDHYIARMQSDQEAIYYITGDDAATLAGSPQLEGFKARGIEVLLMTDHVDDFWVQVVRDFKGKPLRSVLRAGGDLKPQVKENAPDDNASESSLEPLITLMKQTYGDQVKEVRTTAKLSQSPVCLAVGEGEMDIRMERFLLEHRQISKATPKILEINPQHPIIQTLAQRAATAANADGIKETLLLLLDQARVAEGEPVADASAFSRRMNLLLEKTLLN